MSDGGKKRNVDILESDSMKRRAIRNISFRLVILYVGFGLCFGSVISVILLQSSLNIEQSLGTITLTVSLSASVLFSLFLVPGLLQRFGFRFGLVIAQITATCYIIANIYPAFYTLIPASVIQGCGSALNWTSVPIVCIYFGKMHGVYGTKPAKTYARRYTAMFFAVSEVSKIFGNVISWLILHFIKPEDIERADSNFAENYTMRNDTITFSTSIIGAEVYVDTFMYCGANDCQNPNITRDSIERYVPKEAARYALMSVFTGLSVVSTLLIYCFLPKIKPAGESNMYSDKLHKLLKIPVANDDNGDVLGTRPVDNKTMKEALKATLKHVISRQQLLVTPISVYHGMFLGYITADMTRSYASCILGVDKVGLCIICYCSTSILISLIYERIAGKFGRNILFPLFACVEMGSYIFCLLWRPNVTTVWMAYLIFGIFGFGNGFRKNCNIGFYTDFFPSKLEIGLNTWNLYITVGLAIQYALGSLLCVRTKIYILMIVYAASLILYALAEIRFQRSRSVLLKSEENMDKEEEFVSTS